MMLRISKASRSMMTTVFMCSTHGEKWELFCDYCREFLCEECDSHQAHGTSQATDVISKIPQELKMYSVELKSGVMLKCSLEIEQTQTQMKWHEGEMGKILDMITTQYNQLCENLSHAQEHIKWQLQKLCEENMHEVCNTLHDLQNQERQMKELVTKCESIIKSGTVDHEAIEFYLTLPKLADFTFQKAEKPVLPHFDQGDIDMQVMKNSIGHLGVRNEAFHIKVECHIQTNMFIDFISPISEEQAWIGKLDKFCLIHKDGFVTQSFTLDNIAVPPFTLTRGRDIIFSDWKLKSIQKMCKFNNVIGLWCTAPYTPIGLCSTSDGSIVVCLVGLNKGKLVKYDGNTGRVKLEILCKPNGQKLFIRPEKVTENYNCDLCVIDAEQNKVIIVDRRGLFRFDYNGNNRRDFQPSGLCCDKYCNILISDYVIKVIDILSFKGEFLTALILTRHGVSRPMGINIDREGKLWIGQGNGCLHILTYLK